MENGLMLATGEGGWGLGKKCEGIDKYGFDSYKIVIRI